MVATMPGLTYSQAFVVAESSTAVANTVPADGAIGIATSFGMFHSWGFSRSRISVSLLLTGIWNNFAKLSLPVLALALIALQGNPSTGRLIAGLTGIAALIGAITVFALVLRSDAWAQRVGDGLARWVSALQRPLGRKRVEGWGKATRKFRSRTILLLRSRWHCADPGHPGQSPVAVPGVAAGATAHRRVQPGGELGRGAGRLRLRPVGHRDSDHPGRHRHRGGSADRRAVGCRGRAAAGGRRRPGLPGADLRAAHPAGVGGVRVLAAQLLLAAGTERRPPDRARPRVGMKPAAAAAAVTTGDPAHRPGWRPRLGPAVSRHRGDLIVAVVAVAVLVLSALPVDASRVSGPERSVFHWVNNGVAVPFVIVWPVMQLGNIIVVPVAAAVALAARRVRLAASILIGGALVYELAKVVKRLVVRGRQQQRHHT